MLNCTFTFSSVQLHLQKVVEAAKQPKSFRLMEICQNLFFLSVDCLMFDTSRNDAADVYKAQ